MRMRCVKLFSDNCDGVLLTLDAYKAVTLEMSSGDFGAHNAIDCIASPDLVKSYDDLFEVVEVKKPKQKRSNAK